MKFNNVFRSEHVVILLKKNVSGIIFQVVHSEYLGGKTRKKGSL